MFACLITKFDGLFIALNTQGIPQPLSFEEFCALLQEEELRLKAREGGSSSGNTTLSTTTKGKGGANSKGGNSKKNEDNKKKGGKKFKGECFYCKKKGHTIAKCCTKKEYEKNDNLKPYNEGKQTVEVELDLFW